MSEALIQLEEYRSESVAKIGRLADISPNGTQLADIEAQLRQLKDLSVELTGKRSRVAELKKQIGKVDASERPAFAQAVQTLESEIKTAIESAQTRLSEQIASQGGARNPRRNYSRPSAKNRPFTRDHDP